MEEKIKDFLKSFSSCLQLAQMYEVNHPEFDKMLSITYQKLEIILDIQNELTIAIVENELTSGEYIYFDLSKKIKTLIDKIRIKGFEKISFQADIKKSELKDFILLLLMSKEKINNYQEYLLLKGIKSIQLDKIKKSTSGQKSQKNHQIKDLFKPTYLKAAHNLSSSLNHILQNEEINFTKFSSLVDNLTERIDYHYQEILQLSKLKEKDVVTFAHLLNVSFLSMHFSKYLGFNNLETKRIGIASLFHDIGKIYISNKLLQGGKLSDKEFEQIKSHSLLGAEILLKYVDKIGKLAPVVALEHHLKFNSGGYPKLKFPRCLHLASMIVALCDVYDALNQRRSYRNNFPTEQVYKIMKKGRGSQFHPELFDNFFQFMGVWPNGTIVLLNNDKIASVTRQNDDDIFSPEVKIISDSSQRAINLSSNESKLKIIKSLNPYKEGSKYLKS